MALLILDSCINCDMCEPECPNSAISMGNNVYEIDANRCTECVGHYDAPTCVAVCPIDVVKPDPNKKETLDELAEKFIRLTT
ncbi:MULTISPECIES: YfhL family 4Fe-4S dicluster ferredoxin [Alteromonas]|jgi:ferredoxin|uniref:YfhL family 4Fe-4S dicluster ferredoxin n=1 Tax=Alteromonas TaxID=226 RepID=UPI00090BBA36|nr:YfhL family 4Fe-4S dicluster ferredoxin [Alteromonas sp. KUL150]APD86543.1 ferredoxin [Alteromonas sp. Mex14]GFD74182.1 ferredoxin [Tenacibaculum sp. KUL113]GFD84536.1 ferredoxin [Alteromonas sp. KUL150]